MPMFMITHEQWVQEIAVIEVEADTAEDALRQALADEDEHLNDGDLDWADGNDSDYHGITEVQDAEGRVVLTHEQIKELS